jgi:hypothetical protein
VVQTLDAMQRVMKYFAIPLPRELGARPVECDEDCTRSECQLFALA